MKAIVIQGPGKAELVNDHPEPKLRPHYVRVKTVAVALNPTDWKHVDYVPANGAVVGCDFSGIIAETPSDGEAQWKKGDEVFGFVHGGNATNESTLQDGGFAEYLACKEGAMTKKPEGLSFEDAATFGCGIVTVGQTLYQSLRLPLPTEPAKTPFPLLIYGGSTATGTLAIQWAKLSGLTVVATCSPHNFDLCKSLGADKVFDYNSPTCGEDIRAFTNDSLHYALDNIGSKESAAICCAAMSSKSSDKKLYTSLIPVSKDNWPRADVENHVTMAYSAFGEEYAKVGRTTPAKPEDYEFQIKFWGIFSKLLAEGKIKPHPSKVGTEGLKGVLDGMQQMREGKVSGVKLVYKVADTP